MDDFERHMQSFGVSMAESRAAADYAKARTADELHVVAGDYLALHATAVAAALRLPRRGALILRVMERTAHAGWEQYCRVNNDVFCASALLDLCTVRSVFREEGRWPELASVLDQLMVMACARLASMVEMTSREKEQLHERATDHLIAFQDDATRTAERQIETILSIEGVDNRRVDKAAFVRAAITEPSWLDPWALVRHHDRISARGN